MRLRSRRTRRYQAVGERLGDGGTARGYAIGPSGVWVFEPFTVEEPALPGDRAAVRTQTIITGLQTLVELLKQRQDV